MKGQIEMKVVFNVSDVSKVKEFKYFKYRFADEIRVALEKIKLEAVVDQIKFQIKD